MSYYTIGESLLEDLPKEKLNDIPDIIKSVPFPIYCFKTGASLFLQDQPAKDHDYVITPKCQEHYWDFYEYLNRHSCASAGICSQTFSTKLEGPDGVIYDFILKAPREFITWYFANETMKSIPKHLIRNKKRRVALFEQLKTALDFIVELD